MSRKILSISPAVLVILCASFANAQSLGDAAKKEEARRKAVKPAGKVITNRDLPRVPPPSAAPPVDDAPKAADAASQATEVADKDDKDGKDGKGKNEKRGPKDEKFWSDRIRQARESLRRDQMFADSLQSRINGLTTDFVNRDDPAQRGRIGLERQAAINELDRVRKSLVDRNKAIAEIEEEARRSGVPPAWLR
ncbi:MAG: hypothetical protein FJW27_10430 [Acidimicrobiia bacterium]|nr:hypothetical protein [Acidimicrobiia bacterium]